jgi:beta-N-acetylhexosaminidase
VDRARRDLRHGPGNGRRDQEPLSERRGNPPGRVRRRLPERVYRRRRRVAAGLLAAAFAAALICLELIVSEPIPVDSPDPDAAAAPLAPECEEPAESIGRRLIVRMEAEASPTLRRQAARGEIGGVILFPPPGTEVADRQRAASSAGEPPLIVAIDQEGGDVKRLPELPPEMAPPEIAAQGPAAAREQGLATGRALTRIGVNVDLAPVLDVPATADSFVASRSFGSTPASAAENGAAFAAGLAEGGVAATAKHFPGLGRSAVNTDLEPSEVVATEAELRADLEPFERAIADGIALVMLSNATYPPLDRRLPAFASEPIAASLLRGELGFAGVTITDDLDAGAVTARFDREEAARVGVSGGSDLLLFAQTSRPGVLEALIRDAERGRLEEARLEESCARVLTLRESLAG